MPGPGCVCHGVAAFAPNRTCWIVISVPSGVTARASELTGTSSITLCPARTPSGTVAGLTSGACAASAVPPATVAASAASITMCFLFIRVLLLLRCPYTGATLGETRSQNVPRAASRIHRQHEALDLRAERLDLAEPHHVVIALELDETRAVDPVRRVLRSSRRTDRVAAPAEHEDGHADRGEQMSQVEGAVRPVELSRSP